jgi:hypothetical protein
MACVCCPAIPALQLSRGNGIHGVNPYQPRACHQTIRQVPQAGRWLLYGTEPAGVPRTGKRVRTCEFNNVNILKFLLSRETTLEGLLRLAWRQAKTSREVRVNHDSKLNHTVSDTSDTQNPGHDDRRPRKTTPTFPLPIGLSQVRNPAVRRLQEHFLPVSGELLFRP